MVTKIVFPSSKLMYQMILHSLPGNVRVLENYIERGVILSCNNRFVAPAIESVQPLIIKEQPPVSHQENERQHILKTLEIKNGKISGKNGAAAMLNLHPNTLRYRMKKLEIQVDKRAVG